MNLEEPFDYIESFNKFNEHISYLHLNDNDNDNDNDYNTKSLNPRMKNALKHRMTLASPLQECQDAFPNLDQQIDPNQQHHSQIAIYNANEGTDYYYEENDNVQQENPEIEDISPISIASLDEKMKRKRSNSVQHYPNNNRIAVEKYRISKSSNTSPNIKLPHKPVVKITTIENYSQQLGPIKRRNSSVTNNVGNPFYKPKYKSTTSIPTIMNHSQSEIVHDNEQDLGGSPSCHESSHSLAGHFDFDF